MNSRELVRNYFDRAVNRFDAIYEAEKPLDQRIVGGVERELIEQVMAECDGTQVTAARRLGINRNTLHKKVSDFKKDDRAASGAEKPGFA